MNSILFGSIQSSPVRCDKAKISLSVAKIPSRPKNESINQPIVHCDYNTKPTITNIELVEGIFPHYIIEDLNKQLLANF